MSKYKTLMRSEFHQLLTMISPKEPRGRPNHCVGMTEYIHLTRLLPKPGVKTL